MSLQPDIKTWLLPFDSLQLDKRIGQGAFGTVYSARWQETPVAVKLLTRDVSSPEDSDATTDLPLTLSHPMLTKLHKEASMMAALRHPNCVAFLGVCTAPPCVVTEYCERGSLADVLRQARSDPALAGLLTWPKRLSMALDAAKGMLYLHLHNPPLLHRDLKSPNLLVDDCFSVKVCDFNLSKVLVGESAQGSSVAAGNPRWLAPEVLSGEQHSFASDVYSFGLVLWELMTYELPFSEVTNTWQLAKMVMAGGRPSIPGPGNVLGGWFESLDEYVELLQSCWAQEPSARPSFSKIILRLRKFGADGLEEDHFRSEIGASQYPAFAEPPEEATAPSPPLSSTKLVADRSPEQETAGSEAETGAVPQVAGAPRGVILTAAAASAAGIASASSAGPAGKNNEQLAGDAPLAAVGTQPHPGGHPETSTMPDSQIALLSYSELHLEREIGQGSDGKLYLAKWCESPVAVKMLQTRGGYAARRLFERLTQESGRLASLRHPHVVTVLGMVRDPPCIVTEYCSRGSLTDVVQAAAADPNQAAQLTWPRRLQMMLDAALGMLFLHQRTPPLIHSDLKGPNLLVDEYWRVKVADAILSRVALEEAAATASNTLATLNPRWMAPELLLSVELATCASDVYSYALVMYEALTWHLPWAAFSPLQLLLNLYRGNRPVVPPRTQLPGDGPWAEGVEEYVELMRQCWAQDPHQRPDFRTVLTVLRDLLERAKAGKEDVVADLGGAPADGAESSGAGAARPRAKGVMSRLMR